MAPYILATTTTIDRYYRLASFAKKQLFESL